MTKVFNNGDEAANYYAPRLRETLSLETLALMAASMYCFIRGEETKDGKFVIAEESGM